MKKNRTTGVAPYGYIKIKGGFALHPEEAFIRKLMFELFLIHKRKLTVAKILNGKGYRTRGGVKFSDGSLDRLLRDPIVKGHHRMNYKDESYSELKPKSEWVYLPVEPLISKDIWRRVNDLLCSKNMRNSKRYIGILGDVVSCSCGHDMSTYYRKASYSCKSCKKKIDTLTLVNIIINELENLEANKIDGLFNLGDIVKEKTISKTAWSEEHFFYEREVKIPQTLNQSFSVISRKEKQLLADSSIKEICIDSNTLKIKFGISSSIF